MQPAVLHALEFDRIREALSRETMTPLGKARALELAPSSDAVEVQYRLSATSEVVALLAGSGSLSITAPDGLLAMLDTLATGGQPLEPLELVGLADFVDSVDRACGAIRRTSASMPLLAGVAAAAASFADEAAATRRAIAASGDVVDTASPALRDIRDSLRRQRSRLRATLEGLTRGRDTAKYLQDQIVADRGGRYVLMVRAEHQSAIPGIVHGSSASGASLYLEPLATVQTNNEIVELAEREKAEVFRILLALTDSYRDRTDDLDATLHVAGELDLLQAKARLAARMQAVAPTLATDGRIELRGARHPLLAKTNELGGDLREISSEANRHQTTLFASELISRKSPPSSFVIANDILITPPVRALVISGPNTGGKTVALKAAGLLPLMAQAGLHIPVDPGSTLTPFRSIFADIGDDQSIAASLSTFSARIAHIVEMERALELPALVLLDEVGGGTDPVEGGALGAAVIDHFRNRGATVVATTHDDALKSYAATTTGIRAAAMGFVPETYAPTYRLVYGAPGRSLALEIAERLGMPLSVISEARSRRSNREGHLAEHLARVDKEIAVLEQERQLLVEERRAVGEQRQSLVARESQVTEREAVLRKRLDDRVNEKLREARAEIDSVVAQVKSKASVLTQKVSTGDLGQLRVQGRSALESIASVAQPTGPASAPETPSLQTAPAVGDEVFVPAFGTNGVVRVVSGKHAEVEIRGKRMKVAWRELRGASAGAPQEKPARGQVTSPASTGLVSAVRELMVIGKTIEQATDEAEKFLDAALLADSRRLRVVHGHGTGRLRDAMTKFFRAHPLVATVGPAPDNEGGNGATIVELKD